MAHYVTQPGVQAPGADVGVLHIPVNIPLIPGDAGNAQSYAYPVAFRTVDGSSVAEIVGGDEGAVGASVVAAAQSLERDGVRAIVGDCGTLIRFQDDVSAAVNVPVGLSPLMLVPLACRVIGPTKV